MRISENGLNLIKKYESLHDGDLSVIGLQPKMDPIGIWTEGYGRAMRDKNGNFIKGINNKKLAYDNITIHDEGEAVKALSEDVKIFENIVAKKIKINILQNQFDALVSHTYNTGGSSTLFDYINQNKPKDIIYKWFTEKYITADGVSLPGLIKRRKSEADLFFKS